MAERLVTIKEHARAAAIGVLTVANILTVTSAGKISPDKPLDKPQGQVRCLPVESEILNRVNWIIDQPRPTEIGRNWDYANQQAKIYDLSLIDPISYMREISDMPKPSPVIQILATLNDFTSQYGFSVDMPEENIVVDGSTKYYAFSRESIDRRAFRRRALRFLGFFSYIPVELVRLSGMEHMVLVDAITSGAAGLADINRKSIFIAHGYFNEDLVFHEMSHLDDAEQCGTDAGEDSQFRKLNPKGFKYGQKDEKWIDKAVVDIYGQKGGPVEDKATISVIIMNGFWALDSMSEELKSKLAFRLARLEKEIPHITAYLRSISSGSTCYSLRRLRGCLQLYSAPAEGHYQTGAVRQ